LVAKARLQLKALIRNLGWGLGRQTAQARLPHLPLRLINHVLKILKAEHRAREDARRRKVRVQLRVTVKHAVMGQDSTHVGNTRRQRSWAELQKDLATLKGRARGDGRPINGLAMLRYLRDARIHGRLPLVLMTDNGPAYKCQAVQAWLRDHQVIHLASRPRTPTDNAAVERAIGEAKAVRGLGKGVRLRSRADGPKYLDQALQALNKGWPRASRGGRTANQLERELPHWRTKVSRRRFYLETRRETKRRAQGLSGRALAGRPAKRSSTCYAASVLPNAQLSHNTSLTRFGPVIYFGHEKGPLDHQAPE
jgi:transposase InsO family protein